MTDIVATVAARGARGRSRRHHVERRIRRHSRQAAGGAGRGRTLTWTRPAFRGPPAAGACRPGRASANSRARRSRRFTTFRVGGPADWLVDVSTVDELRATCSRPRARPACPSRCSAADRMSSSRTRACAVSSCGCICTRIQQPAPDRVRAEAGVTINGLVRWTIGRGLAGLEAWAGTPGTVGGAIYGNAHYGGRNIGDLVRQAMLVTPRWRQLRRRAARRDGVRLRHEPAAADRGDPGLGGVRRSRRAIPTALRRRARASLALPQGARSRWRCRARAACSRIPDPARDPAAGRHAARRRARSSIAPGSRAIGSAARGFRRCTPTSSSTTARRRRGTFARWSSARAPPCVIDSASSCATRSCFWDDVLSHG